MLRHPLVARLACQLVPAVLVTVVGVMTLSNLAKPSEPASALAPVQAAITTEAVFTALPREPVETPAVKAAATRPAASPKPAAANNAAPLPPRKPMNEPARQVASAPAPLPIVQIPQQPQVVTAPAPASDNWVVGKLRSATATVQEAPQWAMRSVTGWFSASLPPRPPAAVPVPGQNFQAAM